MVPCGQLNWRPTLSTQPSVDELRARLPRGGWSVGEIALAAGWLVTGTNGREHVIHATGETQSAAWWNACLQARAVGMLARERRETGLSRLDCP
jgi:hypothetical protein